MKPLCSDAFSGFIQADKQVEVHNEEIREASEYLYNRVIPNFVRDSLTWQIMESKSKKQLDNFRVTEAIHTRGICMRHIGLLLPYVRESEEFNEVRVILIMEACARVSFILHFSSNLEKNVSLKKIDSFNLTNQKKRLSKIICVAN